MNTKDKDVEDMLMNDFPEVELPLHTRYLKAVLLTSKRFRRPSYLWLLENITMTTTTQKRFAFGGIVALALVAVVSVTTFTGGSNIAQAQELIRAARVQMFEISPALRAELESSMNVSMADTLAEAYAAPDLRIMTEEEYTEDGNTVFTAAPASSQPSDWSAPVRYLSYTNTGGKRVVLGIDKNNILVMTIQEFSNGMIGIRGPAQNNMEEFNASGTYAPEWTAGTPVHMEDVR